MTTFVGIDLAWTGRYPSGVCVIEENARRARLTRLESCIFDTEQIEAMIAKFKGEVVVAIDAPLIIGETREAERGLGRVFGSAHASAYSPKPEFLAKFGGTGGPDLADRLRKAGFIHLPKARGGLTMIEVYPHAAHVAWFGLKYRLPYKKGPRPNRLPVFREYQRLLADRTKLLFPTLERAGLDGVLTADAALLHGRSLKAHEDSLDALTCALVAKCWTNGSTQHFGDAVRGAVVVPQGSPGKYEPQFR